MKKKKSCLKAPADRSVGSTIQQGSGRWPSRVCLPLFTPSYILYSGTNEAQDTTKTIHTPLCALSSKRKSLDDQRERSLHEPMANAGNNNKKKKKIHNTKTDIYIYIYSIIYDRTSKIERTRRHWLEFWNNPQLHVSLMALCVCVYVGRRPAGTGNGWTSCIKYSNSGLGWIPFVCCYTHTHTQARQHYSSICFCLVFFGENGTSDGGSTCQKN